MTADATTGWFLPVDKPIGPTSHDVVAAARRALGIRRIGHTGTLDPFASGLLILCVGPATRLAEYLDALSKTYVARMRLGASTDTDDRTGTVTTTSDTWKSLATDAIEAALARQVGEIDQTPPAYSARKVEGERLYRSARRGEVVMAPPRRVTVHRAEVKQMLLPDVDIEITCSTGTYIRSIARDVGVDLGCGAHLVALRRTRIGTLDVGDACEMQKLDDAACRKPIESLLGHVPKVEVSAPEATSIRHGRTVAAPVETIDGTVAVMRDGRLVAMAEAGGGLLRPRKVFG